MLQNALSGLAVSSGVNRLAVILLLMAAAAAVVLGIRVFRKSR